MAATLIIAVVLGLMLAPAAGGPPDPRTASAAMAYLPPSGSRVVLQGSDGTDTVDEYFTTVGLSATQSGPVALGYAANGVDEFQTTNWVRLTEVTADAQARVTERNTQLFAAVDSGLELRVAAWERTFVVFRPALPVLPSGVTDGHAWTAAGTASLGSTSNITGAEPYAARFSAKAGEPGCMVITGSLSIGGGNSPTTSESTTTWCRGRGMTATVADGRTATAVGRFPSWAQLNRSAAARPPAVSASGTLARQDMNGLAPMAITPQGIPPAVLPGRLLVFANNVGNDLVARGWSDGPTNARWAAHPGGVVTGLVAVGKVVVATTTLRQVVAYGEQGEFLWQADLDDVSRGTLAGLGNLVVVAGLDGSVRAFDAGTGATRWSRSTPNEIRQPLVVDEHGVTVLDEAGNLRTFAADGSLVHELELTAPESFTVHGDLAVVAAKQDGYVRAYRLTDGTQQWRVTVPGFRNALHAVGDVMVVQRADDLLALRTADGAQAWSRPLPPTAVAVLNDDQFLISDRTTLYLLDAAGSTLASWPTQEADLDSGGQTFIGTGGGELILSHGRIVYRWEAR